MLVAGLRRACMRGMRSRLFATVESGSAAAASKAIPTEEGSQLSAEKIEKSVSDFFMAQSLKDGAFASGDLHAKFTVLRQVEEEFGAEIPSSELAELHTVEDVVDLVLALSQFADESEEAEAAAQEWPANMQFKTVDRAQVRKERNLKKKVKKQRFDDLVSYRKGDYYVYNESMW